MAASPHPFTLRQLQYAVAVADTLGFRRAAERCNVSQPSLSAQLAQLEDALGVRLFERDRRKVLITPAGADLVARARRLLVDADDLVEQARRAGDPMSGTLRIGIIPTVSPYLLPSLAPRLHRSFPRLTIRWVEDRTASLMTSLRGGELDAALLALEAEIGAVDGEVLARDPFVLVTPPDHPLGAAKAPASPADLRGQSVLLLDDGHCFRDQALAVCATAEAQELEFRATSLATLTQMVAAGAGVTLLPLMAVASEGHTAGLRMRRFAEPVPHRTIALVWRPGSPLGAALRQLAAEMKTGGPAPRRRGAPEGARRSRSAGRRRRGGGHR